jgi:hypothetical protein
MRTVFHFIGFHFVAKLEIKILLFVFLLLTFHSLKATNNVNDSNQEDSTETTTSESDRYRNYQDWIFENISLIAMKAEKQGIQCNPQEIEKRLKIFKIMFPNTPVAEHEVLQELKAQKYLEQNYGKLYSDHDIQNEYRIFSKNFKETELPQPPDIDEHLKLKALLSFDEIKSELTNLKLECEKQQYAALKAHLKCWNPDSLKIQGEDDICLVLRTESSECLVSLGYFNENVKFHEIPADISRDSATGLAMKNMLLQLFAYDEALKNGFASSSEAKIQFETALKAFSNQKLIPKFGKIVDSESDLRHVYDLFYDALFKRDKILYLSVIGSSDSILIDSIQAALSACQNSNLENTAILNDSLAELWKPTTYRELPLELRCIADSLGDNKISDLIKTKYGYFILRYDSIAIIDEKLYGSIRKELIYLASKQKWENIDSIIDQKTYDIYHKRTSNMLLDTFFVQVRLSPFKLCNNSIKKKQYDEKPLKLLSVQLPLDVQILLMERYLDTTVAFKDSINVETNLGVWSIKTLSSKPVFKKGLYRNVKKSIRDSLIIKEYGSIFSTKTIDSLTSNSVMLNVFLNNYFNTNDADFKHRNTNFPKTNVVGSNPGEIQKRRINDMKVKRQKVNDWLSKVTLNNQLFSQAISELIRKF